VEVEPDQGAAVGRFLVESDGSAVIDVSRMSKKKRKEFVADFCEAFYRASADALRPRMLVLEEESVGEVSPEFRARARRIQEGLHADREQALRAQWRELYLRTMRERWIFSAFALLDLAFQCWWPGERTARDLWTMVAWLVCIAVLVVVRLMERRAGD